MPNHDIRADLIFDDRKATSGFARTAKSVQQVERATFSAQGAADGLVKKLLAVGGAYASLNFVGSVFGRLTSSAIKYTSSLEATKIGLSSVLAAVEEVPWEKATKMAGEAFEKIKKMSLTSPGSAQDMFAIFNGIVGPIRAAGAPLEKVYELTNDTTLAAAALGVDFQQASRDISMMARGTAGVDVKMFSLLKSTGAIKENAEEWNKSLTAAQRVEKMGAALKKFAGSGEAFGKSWVGVMSSFEGLTDELKRTTFTPVMKAISSSFDRLNTALSENGEKLADAFGFLGSSMARLWEVTLGRISEDSLISALESTAIGLGKALQTVAGWAERMVDGWDRLRSGIQASLPMLKMLAGMYVGSKLLGAAHTQGGAMGGGSGAGTGGTAGGGEVGGGMFAKASHMAAGAVGSAAGGPLAGLAANKAGGAMNYKRAAMASLAFPFIAPGLFAAAAINENSRGGGGGGGAAGEAAGSGSGQFLALASSISAAIVVSEHWTRINAALAPTIAETEAASSQLAVATGKAGMAVGRIWGQFEVLGAGLMTSLAPAINTLSSSLAGILDHVTIWADKINYYLAPAFDYAIGKLGEFASALSSFLAPVAAFFQVKGNDPHEGEMYDKPYTLPDWASGGAAATKALSKPSAVKPSSVTNVNASGARVSIKQEFGNQDPDRVVGLMIQDLEVQAERRLSSAFAGAFTR